MASFVRLHPVDSDPILLNVSEIILVCPRASDGSLEGSFVFVRPSHIAPEHLAFEVTEGLGAIARMLEAVDAKGT